MKIQHLILMFSVLVIASLSTPSISKAQTPGTLSFSVTTTEPAGNYNNVNVIALWIADTNGNFVKTKIRYAASRIQYLNVWIANSAYNTVDATTGPTRTSHGTLTFNWNATDVSGNIVTDKPYRVWIQMSDANLAGPTTYVTFTKDSNSQTINPPNVGNYTNMSLNWNPTIGIREEEGKKLGFQNYPNPMTNEGTIAYELPERSDVTIVLRNLQGQSVRVLFDGNQEAGSHRMNWNANETGISPGLYYLQINTGKAQTQTKVLIEK